MGEIGIVSFKDLETCMHHSPLWEGEEPHVGATGENKILTKYFMDHGFTGPDAPYFTMDHRFRVVKNAPSEADKSTVKQYYIDFYKSEGYSQVRAREEAQVRADEFQVNYMNVSSICHWYFKSGQVLDDGSELPEEPTTVQSYNLAARGGHMGFWIQIADIKRENSITVGDDLLAAFSKGVGGSGRPKHQKGGGPQKRRVSKKRRASKKRRVRL